MLGHTSWPMFHPVTLSFPNMHIFAVRTGARPLLNELAMRPMTIALLVCALAFIPTQGQAEAPHNHSQTTTQSKKTYSCPMHPEVKSKSKGKCPKCGMALRLVDTPMSAEITEASF